MILTSQPFNQSIAFFFVNSVHSLDKKKDCPCKVPTESSIENGKEANPQNYPWLVDIRSDFLENANLTVSHATILNEHTLLTTASCVPLFPEHYQYMKIRVPTSNGLLSVKNVTVHPDYIHNKTKFHAENDIALVHLVEPIAFSQYIKAGCIDVAKTRPSYEGPLFYAGYGSSTTLEVNMRSNEILHFRPSTKLLQGKSYALTTTKECNADSNLLCVKNPDKETQSVICLGDQGTPIHSIMNKKQIVVGVKSVLKAKMASKNDFYLRELCTSDIIATKVPVYADWIKKEVKDEFCS